MDVIQGIFCQGRSESSPSLERSFTLEKTLAGRASRGQIGTRMSVSIKPHLYTTCACMQVADQYVRSCQACMQGEEWQISEMTACQAGTPSLRISMPAGESTPVSVMPALGSPSCMWMDFVDSPVVVVGPNEAHL